MQSACRSIITWSNNDKLFLSPAMFSCIHLSNRLKCFFYLDFVRDHLSDHSAALKYFGKWHFTFLFHIKF